jgi:hypothetical protein
MHDTRSYMPSVESNTEFYVHEPEGREKTFKYLEECFNLKDISLVAATAPWLSPGLPLEIGNKCTHSIAVLKS